MYKDVLRPTPFAFPLMVERFRETVSTERLPDRIAKMVAQLEAAANKPPRATSQGVRHSRPKKSTDQSNP